MRFDIHGSALNGHNKTSRIGTRPVNEATLTQPWFLIVCFGPVRGRVFTS